jgi:hypothetical protein
VDLEAAISDLQAQFKGAQDKAADLEKQLASRPVPRPGLGESAVAQELRITKNELKEHQLEIIGLKERLAAAELVIGLDDVLIGIPVTQQRHTLHK